MFNRV